MGLPTQWVILWLVVGAVVGALVTALFVRRQRRVTRREHVVQLRRREASIDRLKATIKEHAERLRHQDEELRELGLVRRERVTLGGDLDQARRTIAELQHAVDSSRAAARETELRLSMALETERQEAASRRAAAAAELTASQESALGLRSELAAARESAVRITSRLEADLAATRALLERTAEDLHSERAASADVRADLARRVTLLEEERIRLETELSKERREGNEKQQTLRSYVSTLREQYALACTERDAASREAELRRKQADDISHALDEAYAEFGRRLDEEHSEAVNVLSKVWDYVHNYPRLRDRPVSLGGAPLADAPPMDEPPEEPYDLGGAPSANRPEDAAPARESETPAAKPATSEVAPASPAEQPATGEREVPTARPRGLADAPRTSGGREYDIEEALSDSTPHPDRQPGLPTHSTRVRRPVSAMRRDDDILVICDDGSVWSKRPTGWVQESAVPGSEVERGSGATSGTENPDREPERGDIR
ncbi:MAG TPA: hypothetical protein VFW04_18575 [Gemmatimonadaceae bacterium]|nr:hypothetical protein [Gemmatimonadaceae bacterium]